ncbi:MAG TPA: DUF3619 family protein [Methylotenera sp.]|nr:DUF3619 family protein [Methylotenera sp.]
MDSSQINNTEEQMAREMSGLLDEHAQHLHADTIQRLSNARKLAVERLSAQQNQTVQQNGNLLAWFGSGIGQYFGHHRAMSAAMLAGVMMLTFFATQQFSNNNLENSDAFLLASELPPEAFADKGFDTWLESKVD